MLTGTLEPLSRRDDQVGLPVSLRGSLASAYLHVRSLEGELESARFIHDLLVCDDPDILVGIHDGQIVIGRLSELGNYYPDW